MNIEEFVNDYLKEHRHDVLLNPHNGLVEFANALKEQIMSEAMEGEVAIVTYPNKYKFIDCEVPQEFDEGDKVRVIILPKED